MKTLRIFLTVLFAAILGVTTSAQIHEHMNMDMPSSKTETFKVWGKCEMCKARIEKTAIASGATTAEWNVKTKILTVNFDPAKTSVEYLSDKLAKSGHDTENNKAKDKAYNALPDCCKYERVR